uniref:NADH-ubiquinone oxidoreductase chain 4L n=1 Tax=Spathius agrili TaxID=314331 RepID=D8KZU4_SPAAG|nr:NADH dehydrogenase subunit 4L [Spathius agrili]ACJ06263.1 NADH dehydrogenase subunit 4L [Spathius agrili]
MWMNLNYINMLFIISCLMFSFYYKHILLTLISLEFMMINLLYNFYMILIIMNLNIYFINFFISLSICEGVLGLSILVNMIRLTGNDYMNILNLMKW